MRCTCNFWLLILSFLKVVITDIQLELSKSSYLHNLHKLWLDFHEYTFCNGLSLGQESRQLVLPLLLWHHHHFLLHLVISWHLNKKLELVLLTKMLELYQFHYSILNKDQNFQWKLHMIITFVQALMNKIGNIMWYMYKWLCLNWIIKKNHSYITADHTICASRPGSLLTWSL